MSSINPSSAPTPVPSSPPASESFFSELDGSASVLDASGYDFAWDNKIDPGSLNIVSWKLDVNARAEDGVEKRGFNAISTVLNHPTKKANPLRSSRKPLPPIAQPLPILSKPPPPTHYDSYLKAITPLYDVFAAAQSSSSSQPLTEYDAGPDTKSNLPSLDSIPEMYFDPTFNLANPLIWTDVVGVSSNSTDPTIQDSLSSHLDTIERHLEHEITLRSTSFFSALSNLQDLHSESASCLTRIGDLQKSLQEVGSKQARKGLDIIDSQEKLRVARVTEGGIKKIAELEELVRFGRNLIEEGDWTGGLGCLEDIVRWWDRYRPTETPSGEESSPHPILPLSTLPALAILPTTVSSLTSNIASQLEAALSSVLISVLSHPESERPYESETFKGSVEPILTGMVRCEGSEGIEEVWRNAVTVSIREGSRQHLPVTQADDEGDDSAKGMSSRGLSLAQSLQAMDHSAFLLLSAQMYGTMLDRIRLAEKMGKDLAEVLEAVSALPVLSISTFVPDPTSPNQSAKSPIKPSIDLSDIIVGACELSNSRASKILAVRSEQNSALSLEEFVELFKESWAFVLATEGLAQRMIASLRGVTAAQARAFLVSYHAARLTKSAKQVEDEQWSQIDIPISTQHVVNLIIESSTSDPEECRVPPPTLPANGTSGTQLAKVLSIEDRTFFVVKATADTLELLGDYLKIVINLELVVTDVMSRIIEFLKSFNSRTCQVVLGAGAMRSAGLKNITAKHLALASQSLSVVVNLIPYIREFIRRHLNAKQAVMLIEFDKLKRDYQEHQNEIHSKLVAIMSDRLAVHCSSLRAIDWEATPERDAPRSYAEMLVKETATLHKVLSKYLAHQTVEDVMSQVLAAIVHRLSEEYRKVEFKSEDAKKRMMQDVTLLVSRLSPLSESGKSVSSLETLVKDKSTPRKALGQTMSGLLRRSGSASAAKKEGEKSEAPESGEVVDGLGEDDEDGLGMTEEPQEGPKISVEVEHPSVKEEGKTEKESGHAESAKTDEEPSLSTRNSPDGVKHEANGDDLAPPDQTATKPPSSEVNTVPDTLTTSESISITEDIPPPTPGKDDSKPDADTSIKIITEQEDAPPIPEKNDTPL